MASRQPLRRQRPTPACQSTGEGAGGLHATRATQAPGLIGIALPLHAQQSISREVKLETLGAAIGGHGKQGIKGDGRAAIGGQVGRCSVQGQRGCGGKQLASRHAQPHVTGGIALVELRQCIAPPPQQPAVGVEGRSLEFPIDRTCQLEQILTRRCRVPQRALPHGQAREGNRAPGREQPGRRCRGRCQRERLSGLAHTQLVAARRQIQRRCTGAARLGKRLPIGDRALRPNELPLAVVGPVRGHPPQPGRGHRHLDRTHLPGRQCVA